MKRPIILFLILLFFYQLYAQESWTRKSDFPDRRGMAVSFSIDNFGYIGTGHSDSGNGMDFWRYDFRNDRWERFSIMPGQGIKDAFCMVINDKAYIGGGGNAMNTYNFELWEFDPKENLWSQKKDIPFNPATPYIVEFTIGDKGYLTIYPNSKYSNFVQYDPTLDQWKSLATYPGEGKMRKVGFSLNGKGYVGTGFNTIDKNVNEFWEYDPEFNSWARKKDLPGSVRNEAVSFTIGNLGYVGSGWNKDYGGLLYDFWVYSPIVDTWSRIQDCPFSSSYGCTFTVGGKGYFGTGFFSSGNEIWEYTPNISSIQQPEENIRFSIYPNPAKSHINIQPFGIDIRRILIYSSTGQLILEEKSGRLNIPLDGIPPGIYQMVLYSSEQIFNTTFIISESNGFDLFRNQ